MPDAGVHLQLGKEEKALSLEGRKVIGNSCTASTHAFITPNTFGTTWKGERFSIQDYIWPISYHQQLQYKKYLIVRIKK